MADEKMVKVTLDQQRMYRAKHEDRDAITVGPGEVEVPAWVAEEWAKPAPVLQPLQVVDDAPATKADIDRLIVAVDALRAEIEHSQTTQGKSSKRAS